MPIILQIQTTMKKEGTRGETKKIKMFHAKVAVEEVHISKLTNLKGQSASLVSKITNRRNLPGTRKVITSKDDRAVTKHRIGWRIKIKHSQKKMTNILADAIMTEQVGSNQLLRKHEKRQQCSPLRKESPL